jgi:peptidoglycan-associated lipoprotein
MTRFIALALLTLTVVSACKKKPQTGVTPNPTTTGAVPNETCGPACRDSIARANRIRDSIAAAEAVARERAAREAAMAGLKRTLGQTVYFDYDMYDLTTEARALLDAKFPILQANPGLRMRIAGHADERGSDEYNLALGQRRASAVKRYLTDRGIDASRIDVVSFGEERPAVTDGTEESFRLNRRAEFEIVAGGDNIAPPK